MRRVTGLIYSEYVSQGCGAPNLAQQVIKARDSTHYLIIMFSMGFK